MSRRIKNYTQAMKNGAKSYLEDLRRYWWVSSFTLMFFLIFFEIIKYFFDFDGVVFKFKNGFQLTTAGISGLITVFVFEWYVRKKKVEK